MKADFVLQHVQYITGEVVDIVVKNGRINEVTAAGHARSEQVIDCSGMYISSGWIDMHVHAFPALDPYGDDIDQIGVRQGVTTIVDAGSCGGDQFPDLVASSEHHQTNLLAFMNVSRIGLKRVDELSDLAWIDREKVLEMISTYRERIVGLKVRMSKSVIGENGLEPLRMARKLADETGLPLMVHIGSGPPAIQEILSLLNKGDIITHYLHGKPNGLFNERGEPLQAFIEAMKRGVHLDVGHGTASFSFKSAEHARQNDIAFNTISTDIYRGNRLNGPVYGMAQTLSKFLQLGYSLEQVIQAVTINAANWLKQPALGRIQVGDLANLTLFTVENKPIVLTDSEGEQRTSDQRITAKGVVVNGELGDSPPLH